MSKTRRIATVAALPVALGLMFAAPALASASTTSAQAETTVSATSHSNGGLNIGLGGVLNSGNRHNNSYDNESNLGLGLGGVLNSNDRQHEGYDNESNLDLGLGGVLNSGRHHNDSEGYHDRRSGLNLLVGIDLNLGSDRDCDC